MAVESVTKIIDLNPSWPLASDGMAEGDDHIRVTKVAIRSLLTNPSQLDILQATNDLSDLTNVVTARTNLGLGTAAVANLGTGSSDAAIGDHTHTAPTIQKFTTSGTWVKPTGCQKIKVTVVGAGGGGRGGTSTASGPGGGGAGTAVEYIDVSAVASVVVTVGSGGAGGAASTDGSAGGDSVFNTYCTGGGGFGAAGWPVAGGEGTGGDINMRGAPGTVGSDEKNYGGVGGSSSHGGGGVPSYASNGSDAFLYGGGGAGGAKSKTGGAGANGLVYVEEYY